VLVVGAPEGYAGVMASGPVGVLRGIDVLVIGVHVEPGWSGGPVVSRSGELVGLLVRGRESAALAVPASTIRAALRELRR
jgi:S1-C subfamily serine protease